MVPGFDGSGSGFDGFLVREAREFWIMLLATSVGEPTNHRTWEPAPVDPPNHRTIEPSNHRTLRTLRTCQYYPVSRM